MNIITKDEVLSKNSLKLAYIGDAVIEIIIRQFLILTTDFSPNTLHKMALQYVSAPKQATAVDLVFPFLTEEEASVFKRGRNAKCSHIPKNSSIEEYHKATGFESLIGFLYLLNENERIINILSIAFNITL